MAFLQSQHQHSIQRHRDKREAVHNQVSIQKKSLDVSSPEDEQEKEADTIARKVVNGGSATVNGNTDRISRKEQKIQRQTDDEWVKDKNGNLYYDTEQLALTRMETLKKEGAWTEYQVVSFVQTGKTYWRVEMRGPKTKTEGNSTPLTTGPGEGEGTKTEGTEATTETAGQTRTFALTFDDGPHVAELGKGINRTENVLDTLKEKGIKGGFFIQTGLTHRGKNPIGKQLVKRMDTDGHIVGVHTGGTVKDHELHTTTNTAGRLEKELTDAKTYITEQTGKAPEYVRPPEGKYTQKETDIYNKVGLTNLMWDIDGDEGADLSEATLKLRLDAGLEGLKNKNWKTKTASSKIVILYHDIQKGTSKSIGVLIEYIKEKVKKLSGDKDEAKFDKP